jgi:hypothetical protein
LLERFGLCLKLFLFLWIKPAKLEAQMSAAKPCREIVSPIRDSLQVIGESIEPLRGDG